MHKAIDIAWLYRNGYLPLGKLGGFTRGVITWTDKWSSRDDSIGFYISITEEWMYFQPVYSVTDKYGKKERLDYKISLTVTRCNYGGKRYWFICPFVWCHKRVGTLYLGDKYFACHHCIGITYSRNETRSAKWRFMDKRWKLEGKLEDLEDVMSEKRRWYGARLTKFYAKLYNLRMYLYDHDGWLY